MLKRSVLSLSLVFVGLAALLLPDSSIATERLHELRWSPPRDRDVAGYRVYLRFPGGSHGPPLDLGFVAPRQDGVASTSIMLESADRDCLAVMTAYDDAGNESIFSNEILIGASGGTEDVPPEPHASGDLLLAQDWEAHVPDQDPVGWLDTGEQNGLGKDEGLFETSALIGGTMAFGTQSNRGNIHSHYLGGESSAWSAYELSGRMLLTDTSGGIGVTFLSDYPNSDSYYRLRAFTFPDFQLVPEFHLAPHPHGERFCEGKTDSGVLATAHEWYAFRIQVDARGPSTEVRARVWRAGDAEPGHWQIECADSAVNRLLHGTVGVWAGGMGEKYWDDLEVRLLEAGDEVTCDPSACDDGNPCTVDRCTPAGCLSELGPNGKSCNDGDSGTVKDACVSGQCRGVPPECLSDAECSDGNSCNGEERCQDFGCISSAPLPNGTACDDRDSSTTRDQCQNGVCKGMLEPDPEPACNPSTCDDGNVCTVDGCDGSSCRSAAVANGTLCDDGNASTTRDQCQHGVCKGMLEPDPKPACNPSTCDDGNVCTVDSCDGLSCTYEAAPAGTSCNDGNASTTNDRCLEDRCQGTPTRCQANSQCDDGDRWNGPELCLNSRCVPGVPHRPKPPFLLD
jgi:hypothetical protein